MNALSPSPRASSSDDEDDLLGDGASPTDGEGEPAGEETGRASVRSRMPLWLDTLITMMVALLIAVLVKTFLIQPFYIPSASMNPTLLNDDKILVSKLTPGVFDLHRGDVIVFEDPDDWIPGDATENPTPRVRLMMALSLVGLAPDPSQDHLVKRLIGMPGDRVVCAAQGAALEVNGVEIEEDYINQATSPCQVPFDITVPSNRVWVMGDNRHASADSAYHHAMGDEGFIPVDNITGKAEIIFWPSSSWTTLNEGRDAFADVPDPA